MATNIAGLSEARVRLLRTAVGTRSGHPGQAHALVHELRGRRGASGLLGYTAGGSQSGPLKNVADLGPGAAPGPTARQRRWSRETRSAESRRRAFRGPEVRLVEALTTRAAATQFPGRAGQRRRGPGRRIRQRGRVQRYGHRAEDRGRRRPQRDGQRQPKTRREFVPIEIKATDAGGPASPRPDRRAARRLCAKGGPVHRWHELRRPDAGDHDGHRHADGRGLPDGVSDTVTGRANRHVGQQDHPERHKQPSARRRLGLERPLHRAAR